jgi:adenosine kinase
LPENSQPTEIATTIAALPKVNASRPRIVVITQGAQSTILVSSAEPDSPKVFSVPHMKDGDIVDTNGAGDAFAGGFLGGFVLGKQLEECVEAGHKLAQMCVGQVCVQVPIQLQRHPSSLWMRN